MAARKGSAQKGSATSARAAKRGSSSRARTKASPVSSAATAIKGALAGAVASVTTKFPGDTDALALLERDHRHIEKLLDEGEQTTAPARRTRLLHTITRNLNVHEMIEEKVLYPALKTYAEAKDLALEGYQEHHVVDLLVQELHTLARDDERWGAKFKVFKENIAHHIDEEEGPMFRTARAVMTGKQLQQLGAEMMAMKEKEGKRGGRRAS